jgi:hypothetical protein
MIMIRRSHTVSVGAKATHRRLTARLNKSNRPADHGRAKHALGHRLTQASELGTVASLATQAAAGLGIAKGSNSSVPQPLHTPSVAGVTPSHCWQKMMRWCGVVISQSAAKCVYCQRCW